MAFYLHLRGLKRTLNSVMGKLAVSSGAYRANEVIVFVKVTGHETDVLIFAPLVVVFRSRGNNYYDCEHIWKHGRPIHFIKNIFCVK